MNEIKIIDEAGNEISNPDLSKGYLVSTTIVKKDAVPIDNVTKFAWDDSDYEEVYRYISWSDEEIKQNKIDELQKTLLDTDYIPNKIIEELIEDLASATALNFVNVFIDFIIKVRGEYKEVLASRKKAREEINRLEAEQATTNDTTNATENN